MKGRLVCLFCYFVLPSVVQGVGFKNLADDTFIKKDLDEISNKSTIIAKLLRTVVPSPRAFQPSQEQIQQELTDLLEVIGRQRLALIETNDYLQSKVGYNKDVNDKIRYFDGLLNALSYDFTIPGFQRLKEKCQHVDERPYSLFNQVRTMLLSVCHSDIIQAENEKIRKTVDNIHRQIVQYFPESAEEQRIVNKMLSEELGEAEDPIFFLDSLLNDLLNNTSMLKGDFVAAIKKSRVNSGFRPGCILKSLGVELKYERFKFAREVNVFRHDLIKLVADHTICLGALGTPENKIADERKQLAELVDKIEENVLHYKDLMLERFWIHGISEVDYSDVAIDRGDLNKTAADLKANIERYGNADVRYSVISYLNRPEQIGHPPSTFNLNCPPTRCFLETLGGVSFLVIRNPASQDPQVYRRAREWYQRNEDEIRKRIDEKSTHYFAFSIVDNIQSSVDLKSSPFAGTLLLRFYGFGKVELPTGIALVNSNSVECVYYEWNTFFPKKDEVIKFFLIV